MGLKKTFSKTECFIAVVVVVVVVVVVAVVVDDDDDDDDVTAVVVVVSKISKIAGRKGTGSWLEVDGSWYVNER